MANTYDEIAKLSPEKRALLEKLMRDQGIDTSNLPISKRNGIEEIPLSSSQERLWSLWNLAPENPSENVFIAIEVKGNLNTHILNEAVNKLVSKNEIFRTYCIENNGKVFQKIVTDLQIEPEFFDLTSENEEAKLAKAKDFIKQQIAVPIDLRKVPNLRTVIIKLNKEHNIILIVTHQFISDGYSANLILQTLSGYYNSILKGKEPKNEKDIYDYADYAIWQRKRIEGDLGNKQIEYWKDKLKDLPTQLNFPVNKNSDTLDKYNAAIHQFNFSEELSEKLRKFSTDNGFSIFMSLLAALQITLFKLTHQNKIVVTTSVSTRGTSELENIIGNFSNNLMLSSGFTNNPVIEDILKQARKNVGEAFANQDLPLEYLISKLQEESSGQIIPRIQVLFMLRDKNPEDLFKLDGLEIKKFPVEFEHTKLDMFFDIFTSGKDITATLTYKKNLFSAEQINEFSNQFLAILKRMVTQPGTNVDDLPDFKTFLSGKNITENKSEYAAPENQTEQKLVNIWKKFFKLNKIGIHDNYFDIGGHSLLALAIFNEIEKEFGKKLPLATLFKAQTIKELAVYLSEQSGQSVDWSSIVPIKTEGSNPPFFCIHGAGGNVLLYKDLANRLGSNQPFYGIQSKGLDGSGSYHKTIEEMAEFYINDILKIQKEGPYLLGGYCMGGTVAYEIAQQLKKQGLDVGLVAMMDTYNFNETARKNTLLHNISYYYQNTIFHLKNIAKAPGKEKITFIKEKIKIAGERVSEKISSIKTSAAAKFPGNGKANTLLSLQLLNDKAALEYVPKPYNGKVVVFTPQEMFKNFNDESFGWGKLVGDNLKIVELPIYPKGMLVEPFVVNLAESLRLEIEKVIG